MGLSLEYFYMNETTKKKKKIKLLINHTWEPGVAQISEEQTDALQLGTKTKTTTKATLQGITHQRFHAKSREKHFKGLGSFSPPLTPVCPDIEDGVGSHQEGWKKVDILSVFNCLANELMLSEVQSTGNPALWGWEEGLGPSQLPFSLPGWDGHTSSI